MLAKILRINFYTWWQVCEVIRHEETGSWLDGITRGQNFGSPGLGFRFALDILSMKGMRDDSRTSA